MKVFVDPRSIDLNVDDRARRQVCKLALMLGMIWVLASPAAIAYGYGTLQDDDIVVTADPDWAKQAGRVAETFLLTDTFVPEAVDVAQVCGWEAILDVLKLRYDDMPAIPILGRLNIPQEYAS